VPGHKKTGMKNNWVRTRLHGWVQLPEGAVLLDSGGVEFIQVGRRAGIPVQEALDRGIVCVRARETVPDEAKPNTEAGLGTGSGDATPPKPTAPPATSRATPRPPTQRTQRVPETDTTTGPVPTGQELIDRSMRRIGSLIDTTQDPRKLAGVIKDTRQQLDLDTVTKRVVPVQDYEARDRLIRLAGGERYEDVMGCAPSPGFSEALRDEVGRTVPPGVETDPLK